MDVVFDAGEFFDLFFFGHVVVDEAEAALEGHGDGHGGFCDGIHVCGDEWDG